MDEKIVQLSFGSIYPSLLEDDDGLLLEPGDGLEGFRFPETAELDSEELSSWAENHFSLDLDGDLDNPEVFESISFCGFARFGDNDAYYDAEKGLTLNNIIVYMRVLVADVGDLDEEALNDLFHTVVIKLTDPPFVMDFTEFEDYEALRLDSLPDCLVVND